MSVHRSPKLKVSWWSFCPCATRRYLGGTGSVRGGSRARGCGGLAGTVTGTPGFAEQNTARPRPQVGDPDPGPERAQPEEWPGVHEQRVHSRVPLPPGPRTAEVACP